MNRDLVITWPKSRSLDSYLHTCNRAWLDHEVINYRVAHPPRSPTFQDRRARVYVVYDGFVRGYNELLHITYREDDEVFDPVAGGFWPAGFYLVRDPKWHSCEPVPMRGFQGWRYYDAD